VAVIGAGVSGLAAAARLEAAGVPELVVLEATDRVGGRLLSEQVGPDADDVVEAGGQFFGPNHTALLELAKSVGVDSFPLYVEGSALFRAGSELIPYDGYTLPLADAGAEALDHVAQRLDELARTTPVDAPWEAADALALDRMSAAEWVDQTVPDALARAVLKLRFSLSFTLSPERTSMLHVAAFFAAVDGWEGYSKRLTYRARGGTARIPERLAERLGDAVMLSSPVRSIRRTNAGAEIVCDGHAVTAERVIVAMSPGECRRIDFRDSIDDARHVLHTLWQNGVCLKSQFVYPEPFWRKEGLSGLSLSVDEMPCATFDNSPPSGAVGVIMTLLTYGSSPFTPQVNQALVEPPEVRQRKLLEGIAARYGEAARAPERVVETSWPGVPYMAGAVTPPAPGVLTAVGTALRRPIGPIHWAGTETGRRWTGWIEGAIEAGQRAADEVLAAL
jgi:monoamine oxidase